MSKTMENLAAAFAGESQARNKYTYFAEVAREEGYHYIAKIFEETADNERQHAKDHFKTIYERYPEIVEWNVLNESYSLVGGLWEDKLGPMYPYRVLEMVRSVAPKIKPYYNDQFGDESWEKDVLLCTSAEKWSSSLAKAQILRP